jgi:hypothetical protein
MDFSRSLGFFEEPLISHFQEAGWQGSSVCPRGRMLRYLPLVRAENYRFEALYPGNEAF